MATGGPSETGSASVIERGTDETFESDNLCSPCSRRNKNTEGSKYCTDCQKYFCSICVDWHNDFPSLRNHQILEKAKLMQVKNCRRGSVRGTFIRNVCELDDGTIIESYYNQRTLKRLESFLIVTDSCRVPKWPQQVCTINRKEIAVCCGNKKLIQFVSIELKMQTTRQIKTGFYCTGLAYNDEKLFVSDGFPSVYIYTLAGERLQQFNKPDFWGRMFEDTINVYTSIAVSSDGSTIYIAHSTKGLIILNRNGQLVREFNDSKLGKASGVCLYKNNSVLVSGEGSNNILQFTLDGKLIGEVPLPTLDQRCFAVCCCKKTSKLIVGYYGGTEVYDIKE